MTRQQLYFLEKLEFGEFPKFQGIWGVPQIPKYLGNFHDSQNFLKSFRNFRVVYF